VVEGTLAFTTEVTLKVDALPPSKNIMVVAHFHSIQESQKPLWWL
jgi:FAD/FMN-containing dehydrogenase